MINLILFAVSEYKDYVVAVDVQYVIPVFYFSSFIVCTLLHRYAKPIVALIVGLGYIASLSFFAYSLYHDYTVWKYILPGVVIFGGVSGLFGWVRVLVTKIKNIGDDDKFIG